MNLVFLTSDIPHQLYLINEVHRRHPVRKVFFEDFAPSARRWGRRLTRVWRPRHLRMYARSLAAGMLFHREKQLQAAYEHRMFFGGRPACLGPEIPVETVESFSVPQVVDKVRLEAPDLIVVFGTGILRGEILDIAKLDILNIHRGILPKYRGGGLPEWTLYNGDFDELGVTIHQCTAQLDAGSIVGQRRYALQGDDHLYTLRYRTTRLAAELLCDVIKQYSLGTVDRQPQHAETNPHKLRDLTLKKMIIARRNLARYTRELSSSGE